MACLQYGRNTIQQQLMKNMKTSSAIFHKYDEGGEVHLHHPLFYAAQGVRYRKLQVILTTSIDKLGKAGETVKVAPGYFRNHLMPKLLAVPNIDKYRHLMEDQRKIYQREEVEEVKIVPATKEDKMKGYQMAANHLDRTTLVLRKLAKKPLTKDDNGGTFIQEPVGKDEIVAEGFRKQPLYLLEVGVRSLYPLQTPLVGLHSVARQISVRIEPEHLVLDTPLHVMGEFEVPLRMPRSIPLPEGKTQWVLQVKIRGK
ncbi:hypothetical protein RND71_008344 [Anisodus tanguticus]|uniref:Large ribosomal subunit protein bL9c n=1 Tax=Anisodus tanguticus TaxID=243964 RepID=A0AAE1SN30_9SOLA|nr:hypothetical protein RND71_008344 [Anisodus tanguticus]